jgi:hypothetical protein
VAVAGKSNLSALNQSTDTEVAGVRSHIPRLEKADRAWDEAEARTAYWRDNYPTLLEKYPEHFVAVANGAVVAVDSNLDQLLSIISKHGYQPRRVWIRFMTSDVRRVMP